MRFENENFVIWLQCIRQTWKTIFRVNRNLKKRVKVIVFAHSARALRRKFPLITSFLYKDLGNIQIFAEKVHLEY